VPLITSSLFGIGFAYLLDPEESSVATSIVSGDPAESGFGVVVLGDDQGGGWDLLVVVCGVGGALINSQFSILNSQLSARGSGWGYWGVVPAVWLGRPGFKMPSWSSAVPGAAIPDDHADELLSCKNGVTRQVR
jgi:hypothetical protein